MPVQTQYCLRCEPFMLSSGRLSVVDMETSSPTGPAMAQVTSPGAQVLSPRYSPTARVRAVPAAASRIASPSPDNWRGITEGSVVCSSPGSVVGWVWLRLKLKRSEEGDVKMATSDVLVALARSHFHFVMSELQSHLKAVRNIPDAPHLEQKGPQLRPAVHPFCGNDAAHPVHHAELGEEWPDPARPLQCSGTTVKRSQYILW
ncbi:uncharacterized protein LOC135313436 [Phalacrocorax carbo]|uniref:uncharacterized protein LOC135313436 n=1 Tax=Phalacrocorax carbo TaxID=9209 RepID=UPI003119CCCF